MNTAKLHIIAKTLATDLRSTKTTTLLQQTIQALQNQINQPQQGNHSQKLAKHLEELYSRLEDSRVNDFSPAWRDSMLELHIAEQFGSILADRIRGIFERNTITPQVALDELQAILAEITGTESSLQGLVHGLEYFDVGEDALSSHECEVGVIIPRCYVHDNLREFGSELVEVEKFLLVFSELATGKREPVRIRNISSSELSVFLNYIPEVGACIAIAVERIVALYKQMLEIKKLKLELVGQNVPEEKLTGIDEHAASIVSPQLDQLAKDLMEEFGDHLDQSRKNEVSIELRYSLNKLANRIDRGFNIELRASPPDEPEDKEDDDSCESTPDEEARRQILNSAANIQHLSHSGEPVLSLPEQDRKEKFN